MNKKLIAVVAIIAIAVLVVGLVYAAGQYYEQQNLNIAEYAGTAALEVKLDGVATPNLQVVNWGNITTSTHYSKTLSIKNTGNTAVTVTLYTINVPSGFAVTWGGNNTSLPVGDTVVEPLTMDTAAALTPQTYEWTTIIRGTQ